MSETSTVQAEFWFDPICPWAWMTSRWMLEVEKVRPVRVTWNVMSLSVLNDGRDVPEEYVEILAKGWGPVRVITAVREQFGDTYVLPLYTAMGNRIHRGGRQDLDAITREALIECGLPEELADLGQSTDVDIPLRASHDRAIALVGDDVGTPVIAVPGDTGELIAFFGPVVTPAPKGEAAGRLWDGTLLVAGTPGFYEIKRSRTAEPSFE